MEDGLRGNKDKIMKVSIIITCYNREKHIARAIRSALSQSFEKDQYEVIVVDDGSSDNSLQIIKDFEDDVRIIEHKENKGLPTARNNGIKKAKGRFIVHLDSDDYMQEDLIYIEYLHLAFNPDWGAVACDYYEIDENEEHVRRLDSSRNPIACGLMFRKENLIDIGLYNEEMLLCEDEELRERYEKKFKIGFVKLPLYRYLKHNENMTNDEARVTKYRKKIKKN